MPELFGKAEDVLAGPPKAALTFHNKVMLLTEMITEVCCAGAGGMLCWWLG